MDIGARETDKLLRTLEQRLGREYKAAAEEVVVKAQEYFKQFKSADAEWYARVQAGKTTMQEWQTWRKKQIIGGRRWGKMLSRLSHDMQRTNEQAVEIAREVMPDIYAVNMNWATYTIEKAATADTSFTLYNRDAVKRLVRDNPQMLPDPKPGSKLGQLLAHNKALRWHQEKITSAMIQGILTGNTIPELAERIKAVSISDHKSALRYARTMTNGTMNRARLDAGERAEKMGIDIEYQWNAIYDERTRTSHRLLNGERKKGKDSRFSNGLRYPGDTSGDPSEWWNCRCRMSEEVAYVHREQVFTSPKLGNMTYEEWLKAKPVYKRMQSAPGRI